jgi:SAM-dependent methyltransferase
MKRLTKLANKYETDKGTTFDYKHGFTEFYEPFLRKYEHPRILELGVGGGGSEKMFDKYYDGDCEIYCVDIMDLGYLFEGKDNIHFFNLDLGNENDVLAFINSLNGLKFDIIIDDASHVWEHQFNGLTALHDMLSDDGIYILEDLHYSRIYGEDPNVTCNSPLYFLSFMFRSNSMDDKDNKELLDKIEDIYIFSHRNESTEQMREWYGGRSMTAVITFRN